MKSDKFYGPHPAYAHHPHARSGDVPDFEADGVTVLHVRDGMDHGQVTLHTGEEMKQSLSGQHDGGQHGSCHQQRLNLHEVPKSVDNRAQHASNLHQHHVVGEEVGVAHPRAGGTQTPPSPDAQAEDEDEEREEEEDVDADVCGVDDDGGSRRPAQQQEVQEGRVGGEGGVNRHGLKETEHRKIWIGSVLPQRNSKNISVDLQEPLRVTST